MTSTEIDALLLYVEFHLVNFVESFESKIDDVDITGTMYCDANSVLLDLRNTLETQQLLNSPHPFINSPVDKQ